MKSTMRSLLPAYSIRFLLGVVFVSALLSLLLVALRSSWDRARSSQNLGRMKQLAMGIHSFEQTFKAFPAATFTTRPGAPPTSWRVRLVPYMESVKMSYDYRQPWNSPANKHFERCALLYCWDQAPNVGEEMSTTVFGIVGPGAFFDESRTERLLIDESNGDLICAIEVRNSGIHWMQPGDLDYREMVALEREGKLDLGIIEGGFSVLFLDGAVWRLRDNTPRATLLKFMTVESARQHEAEELLSEHREN